jgi:protein-disulfide isomerase
MGYSKFGNAFEKLKMEPIMKKFILISLLFSSLILIAQAPARSASTPAKKAAAPAANSALPTKDDVEAAMKRYAGWDPGTSWVIYDISPSIVPGLADVTLSINKQQPQHVYYYAPNQSAIIGELIPFGPNPFASDRTILQAADGPSRGPQSPVITMVEFSDLECPHCKAAQPVLEKLVGDFPQVRYIFQQFPLPASMHPWAMKAAEYADCVGRMNPPLFWKYVDAIFENQGSIAAATADDKLKEFATTLGLDPQKLSTCAADPQTGARVKKSMDLGASLNVTQTPTLFLNGRRVLGITPPEMPYEKLKELVQFEIDHANK